MFCMSVNRSAVGLVGALLALSACASAAAVEDPRSSADARTAGHHGTAAATAGAATTSAAAAADVRFMRDMMVHHAQALEMSELAPSRTTSEDVLLLARRIYIAQRDEIALMERWLREQGEEPSPVHDAHAHHDHGADAHAHHGHAGHAHAGDAEPMHGMLSAAEMQTLAASSGAEFDRRFLEFMIRHHEGAVAMIAELFESEDGGQDSEVFQMASHMDSDQRIEIARMYRMLAARQQ
jgi:uncharacterized protein (DUF305 family)